MTIARAKILQKVRDLIGLASSPQKEEARNSAYKACEVIREHKLVVDFADAPAPSIAAEQAREVARMRVELEAMQRRAQTEIALRKRAEEAQRAAEAAQKSMEVDNRMMRQKIEQLSDDLVRRHVGLPLASAVPGPRQAVQQTQRAAPSSVLLSHDEIDDLLGSQNDVSPAYFRAVSQR